MAALFIDFAGATLTGRVSPRPAITGVTGMGGSGVSRGDRSVYPAQISRAVLNDPNGDRIVELSPPVDAAELLEREFLEIRARLLQVAAALDRIDRAQGNVLRDKRRMDIDQAIEVLAEKKAHRAERLQMIFSLPYDRNWKKTLGLHNGKAPDAE